MACFIANKECIAQHMNAADAPCGKASANAAETSCFVTAATAADRDLNHVYKVIVTTVQGDDLLNLKRAQRLWIQFRNSNCSAERALYSGGSAAPMVYYSCLEAVTRHRTVELKTMYGWRVEKAGRQF
jgi:uncharacterized protein YecT (DUF1311 family)